MANLSSNSPEHSETKTTASSPPLSWPPEDSSQRKLSPKGHRARVSCPVERAHVWAPSATPTPWSRGLDLALTPTSKLPNENHAQGDL